MSLHPNAKSNIVALQQEHDRLSKEKRAKQAALDARTLSQANLEGNEGVLEFKEEKGPAPQPKKKELSLGLDSMGNKKEDELPASIREQHRIRLNKRQRNRSNKANNDNRNNNNTNKKIKEEDNEEVKFNEQVKKLKTNIDEAKQAKKINNKYGALAESSSEDEGELGAMTSRNDKKAFQSKEYRKFRINLSFRILG